jgi:SPP1 gp7 family putative phage head morphogenesis protein
MNTVTTYTEIQRRNYDPTNTTALRNLFASDMNRRFKAIMAGIVTGVYKNDCFGLKERPHILQVVPPAREAFAYARSSEKVAKFMEWLQKQIESELVTVINLSQVGTSVEAAWMNKYIYDSYKRGVIRARYEMIRQGMQIPSIDDAGGIEIVMGTPFHLDRVGLLFTRIFTDLKGITETMDYQISRILAQGLIDGDAPRLLARKLVSAIDGSNVGSLGITDTLGRFIPARRRAEILARTEIIRAHHLATIQEYRNWRVLNITVKGEWKTAGDDRVCIKCANLEGKIFTLDEIEPMIPLHPQCRCIALPYIEELEKYNVK